MKRLKKSKACIQIYRTINQSKFAKATIEKNYRGNAINESNRFFLLDPGTSVSYGFKNYQLKKFE
jgi:hypothetical protein